MTLSERRSLTPSVADATEFDLPPASPLGLLQDWLTAANAAGVRDPFTLTLATVAIDGQPSTRSIALQACDERGLVFFTNLASRKGCDLRANPRAAATLYWRETMQQVNVAGQVEVTGDEESDRMREARGRPGQVATMVSERAPPWPTNADFANAPGPLRRRVIPSRDRPTTQAFSSFPLRSSSGRAARTASTAGSSTAAPSPAGRTGDCSRDSTLPQTGSDGRPVGCSRQRLRPPLSPWPRKPPAVSRKTAVEHGALGSGFGPTCGLGAPAASGLPGKA